MLAFALLADTAFGVHARSESYLLSRNTLESFKDLDYSRVYRFYSVFYDDVVVKNICTAVRVEKSGRLPFVLGENFVNDHHN